MSSAMLSEMTACITTQNRRPEGRQGDTRDLQCFPHHPSISNNKAFATFFFILYFFGRVGGEVSAMGGGGKQTNRSEEVPSVTFKQKQSRVSVFLLESALIKRKGGTQQRRH